MSEQVTKTAPGTDNDRAILSQYEWQQALTAQRSINESVRKERAAQYEVERQEALDALNNSGPMDWLKGYAKSTIVGGARDALVTASQKVVEGVGWGMEKVSQPLMQAFQEDVLGRTSGAEREADYMKRAKAGESLGQATEAISGGIGEAVPEVERVTPGHWGEELPRAMAQFFTLYGPAVKALKIGGSGAIQGDMAAGALADMLAYENKTGTFSDIAREFGFDNEVTQFLSGELSDNEFNASMKAALEGAGMGALFYAIAPVYHGLKQASKRAARNIGTGPVAGSPAAQRGAIGDLSGSMGPSGGAPSRQVVEPVADNAIEIGGKTYRPDRLDKGYQLVMIDAKALDKMWRETAPGNYVGSEGTNQIGDRINQFKKYWDENNDIAVGSIHYEPGGAVQFGDGRHRARVMIDSGMEKIPVAMEPAQIKALQDDIGQFAVTPAGGVARATVTSAEQKYFDQILASEADRAELLDAAPSARMENGEFMVDPADIEGLRQWIDDTVAAGGKIPPGLRNDDFLKRLEAQGAGAPRETAEVVSLADRRQQAKQEHERILNEIRMRATDELQGMQTEARMKDIDPDSVHKIGDRFMAGETSGPTAERRGQGRVRLEIKGYDSVSDDGTVRYLVEQTFPDGTKAEVRLTNENLQGAQKFGGLESAPAARAATVEPTGREMPFEERIDKYLTDEEKLLMTPKDRETMERLLTTTATPEEVASMAAAGGTKRGWYAESAAALRHIFGDDADRFAMLLSATSPQTSVESNLRNALNVWKNWTKAGRPTDLKEIKRIMGESVEGDKGEDSVLGAWINNSARALSDPNAMPIRMSGPKVNSFWRNLMGQLGEVTQDTWMARALGMSQARDFSGRNLKQFADEIGSLGQKKPGYLAGNILVREAADIMSRATGEQWTPAEIQETVWSWAKAIYEAKGAKGETRNIPEILMSGEITDDIIRDTPDFATLFGKKGEFRSILEEAGYGQQIGNLPASGFGSRRAVSTGPEGQRNLGSAARRLDRTSRERGIGSAEDIYQFARRLVRPVGDPGSTPGTYRSRNRGLGGGALKDTPVKQYYLPPEKKAELEKLKVPTPTLNEFQAPEKFHEFVAQAKANAGNKSAFLTLYSPEEYANMRTFVTTDGSAGFAIKPDGDIVSVFNNRAGPNKGISPHLISLAIEQGGKKLDAYDGMLMDVYGDMGFVETGRDKWDPKYKPDDWDEATFGTPDVVYMELEK